MAKVKAKKTREPKTLTLGTKDDPHLSLLKGHVGPREFNKAFKAEGWKPATVRGDELVHEFWKKLKKGWMRSEEGKPKAIPVTVLYW